MSGNFTAIRTITYASGAIIYAANHNTNETTIYTAHNNAFNASTGHQHTGATGDAPKLNSTGLDLTASYPWTGAHTFTDASPVALGSPAAGLVSNLGITYSAGRLQITSASGSALSSTNMGYIAMPSTTSGVIKKFKITSTDHWFDDDTAGTSSITGEEFGVTSGVAWGDLRPFFIYAVNGDDTDANVLFAISPMPNADSSPSSGNNIGYRGTPATTPSDTNFFFLTSTNVTASHNNKPCRVIGTIEMTMAATDDWTVTALSSRVGIGRFVNLYTEFDMPTNQMGAAAVKLFLDNGGTAPSFTSNYKRYRVNMDGTIDYAVAFQSGTTGAGAVTCYLSAPYKAINPAVEGFWHGCAIINNSGATQNSAIMRIKENESRISFLPTGGVTSLLNSNFGAVDNNVFGTIRYLAFGRIF